MHSIFYIIVYCIIPLLEIMLKLVWNSNESA